MSNLHKAHCQYCNAEVERRMKSSRKFSCYECRQKYIKEYYADNREVFLVGYKAYRVQKREQNKRNNMTTQESLREEFKSKFYNTTDSWNDAGLEMADWWSSRINTLLTELEKSVEGIKIRGQVKKYDGNNLSEAGDVYGIAPEGWSEIIRYEDGHDAAINETLTLISNLKQR